MSKIANINLTIQEVAEDLGIESSPAEMSYAEKEAVIDRLRGIIKTNSCEEGCPHRVALNFLED